MRYSFKAYGHENITSLQRNTFEFTKDSRLTLNGDCIIGVNSDFSLVKLREFIKKVGSNKVRIIISVKDSKEFVEEIICELNPDFSSDDEFVVRKTGFISERTFGIYADKSSKDFSREFVKALSFNEREINVDISIYK